MPKVSKALKTWRSRQSKGAIMKPSTFQKIVRSAVQKGARSPKKVAGFAYWQTARAKFRK